VATQTQTQTLKLIPIPREVSPGPVQSLAGGVQINCAAPCAAEDSFAIDDLKSWLASLGVPVNPASAVNILVMRYGTSLAHSIYADALPPGTAASAEMLATKLLKSPPHLAAKAGPAATDVPTTTARRSFRMRIPCCFPDVPTMP